MFYAPTSQSILSLLIPTLLAGRDSTSNSVEAASLCGSVVVQWIPVNRDRFLKSKKSQLTENPLYPKVFI